MKRVSIACELVALTRPAALLCDEPTAGLDSSVAEGLIKNLRDLSRDGITIGLILQQPRPEIFASLDKVFLMKSDGSLVYTGPSTDAAASLQSRGYSQPEDCSDADFCIDVLNNIIIAQGDGIAEDKDIESSRNIRDEPEIHASIHDDPNLYIEKHTEDVKGVSWTFKSYQDIILLQMRRAWTRSRGSSRSESAATPSSPRRRSKPTTTGVRAAGAPCYCVGRQQLRRQRGLRTAAGAVDRET